MSIMKVHRSTQELQEIIEGYKALIELYKKQLWELRLVSSENEKNINLLQGYKKVIKDLTAKLRRKDS